MADSLRKVDRRDGLAQDDPLYELTRIMGLERARPPRSHDDFDLEIDLENELLGEWADAASAVPARVKPARPAPDRSPSWLNPPEVGAFAASLDDEARSPDAGDPTPDDVLDDIDPLDDVMASMASDLADEFTAEQAVREPPATEARPVARPDRFDPEIDLSEWRDLSEVDRTQAVEAAAYDDAGDGSDVSGPTPASLTPEAEAPGEGAAWGDDALDFDELDFGLADEVRAEGAARPEPSQPAAEVALADTRDFEVLADFAVSQADDADETYGSELPRDLGDDWIADAATEADARSIAAVAAHLPPEIDTVEVPGGVVALADDLGIPELEIEDEPATVQDYDDLEAEFATAFNELKDTESYQGQWQPTGDVTAAADDWQAWDAPAAGVSATKPGAAASSASPLHADVSFSVADFEDEIERSVAAELAQHRHAYDDDLERDIALPYHQPHAQARPPLRRGMVVAALVAGVALAGAAGAYALAGKGNGLSGPVLVRADPQPMKVKPANPGGTAVMNQDNKVYDRVGGDAVESPAQQKLVTTEEEPLDIRPAPPPASVPSDPLAGDDRAALGPDEGADGAADMAAAATTSDDAPAFSGKSEERVTSEETQDQLSVSATSNATPPRRVRTMVVRPDGTLAPREETPPAGLSDASTTGAIPTMAPPADIPVETSGEETGPVASAAPDEEATAAAEEPASAPAAAAEEPAPAPVRKARQQSVPDAGPIAPPRPDDPTAGSAAREPPTDVASAATASAPAQPVVSTVGRWAMQIASQPTEEAAQSSYQGLLRRFGNVIAGKPASIVRADVPGKGTMWRVRVAAESKSEAQALCIQYKAAGGGCFVSK